MLLRPPLRLLSLSLALLLIPCLARATPRDQPPVVSTISNTTVAVGSGLAFGLRASDPDGDPILSFTAADLPPGATFTVNDASNTTANFNWTPTSGGNFFPVFTACNALCGSAKVFLSSCSGCFVAYLTTVGSNQSLRISGGQNNDWCVQVQPDYHATASQIVPTSIVMHSDGTGSVSQINADPTSTGALGDKTNDGIQEMTACFARADLQRLFSNITAPTTAYVTVSGSFVGGGSFLGNLVLPVSP